MPELPEVETMRRGILSVTNAEIIDVHWPKCSLKPIRVTPSKGRFRRKVIGHTIREVGRLGKRVLLKLENDDAIIFEPRMTGLVLLADPPDAEHLRLGLVLRKAPVKFLWYWDRRGLGSVRALSPKQVMAELGPGKLGPDALKISAQSLRAKLGASRRAIKVALLDQRTLAGIGNLYASEILHVAGIHPAQACHRLSKPRWQAIHAAMQGVLHEAIRYEGSTLGDGTYRNALNQAGGYQNQHRVYAKSEQACPTCGKGTIRRIVQAQRSTFFCPKCQKR